MNDVPHLMKMVSISPRAHIDFSSKFLTLPLYFLQTNQLYEPMVLPSNQLFRPPKSKVVGLKNVDYLGKAKVVSELPESSNNNNETVSRPFGCFCMRLRLSNSQIRNVTFLYYNSFYINLHLMENSYLTCTCTSFVSYHIAYRYLVFKKKHLQYIL